MTFFLAPGLHTQLSKKSGDGRLGRKTIDVSNKIQAAGFAHILVLYKEYHKTNIINSIVTYAHIVNSQIEQT